MPGCAQPIGGGQYGGAQPVHGVEQCNMGHPDIVPDRAPIFGERLLLLGKDLGSGRRTHPGQT
ncbi:hypothetical protein GCM10027280_00910 [Micromonospora polyrhachis]